MKHVDALSRMSCLVIDSSVTHRLKVAHRDDEWTKAIRAVLDTGDYEDFYMDNGILQKHPVRALIVLPV